MAPDENMVPKVHPLSRDATDDDPLELTAELVGGDPSVMLDCVLQEFAWMGLDAEELVGLFHHPGYPVLCELRAFLGEQTVRNRVERLISQWGVMRFREVHGEPDPDDDDTIELVQLTLGNSLNPSIPGGPCTTIP